MKIFFVVLITLASLIGHSQCVECTSLPEALVKPELVKELRANPFQNGAKMDSLPATIAALQNLEILYLTDQEIRSIPPVIGKLTKLKELSFAGCKLQSLPEEIYMLPSLKEVILLDNSFSEDYKKQIKQKFRERLPGTKVLL